MSINKNKFLILSGFLVVLGAQQVTASECPVGYVTQDEMGYGVALDKEFGVGTSDKTTCLKKRKKVKVVMQLNKSCRDSYAAHPVDDGGFPTGDTSKIVNNIASCSRSYALGNLTNMINDYTITNGIDLDDIDIKVIVHSGGGFIMLNDTGENGHGDVSGRNKFQSKVEELMNDYGVRFYFCQNTARSFMKKGILPAGDATAQLIDGVEYVTAGVTAIADLQKQGYKYVQP